MKGRGEASESNSLEEARHKLLSVTLRFDSGHGHYGWVRIPTNSSSDPIITFFLKTTGDMLRDPISSSYNLGSIILPSSVHAIERSRDLESGRPVRRRHHRIRSHDRDRPTRALLSAIFQGKLVPHEIDLLPPPPVSLPPSPHFSFLPVPGSLSSRVFA